MLQPWQDRKKPCHRERSGVISGELFLVSGRENFKNNSRGEEAGRKKPPPLAVGRMRSARYGGCEQGAFFGLLLKTKNKNNGGRGQRVCDVRPIRAGMVFPQAEHNVFAQGKQVPFGVGQEAGAMSFNDHTILLCLGKAPAGRVRCADTNAPFPLSYTSPQWRSS